MLAGTAGADQQVFSSQIPIAPSVQQGMNMGEDVFWFGHAPGADAIAGQHPASWPTVWNRLSCRTAPQLRCTACCCHMSVFMAGASRIGQVEASTVLVQQIIR